MADPIPVICLAGPTGSGKTAIAVAIAELLDCEIINADSRQVYADFPIITAQPSSQERHEIPHYFYGYLRTSQKTNAGQWALAAARKASEIIDTGRIPLFVGGTGLYFQTLLHGIAYIPPVDAQITAFFAERMQKEGSEKLYGELEKIDPDYARRIHPHDRQRIQRALEVKEATGKTFSWWHDHSKGQPLCSGPLFVMDISLAELEPTLEKRVDFMLASGAMEEVIHAWDNCPDEHAPGWSGIGCRECLAHLQKKINLDECVSTWKANTRAYAKRQLTWFRAKSEAIWIKPQEAVEKIIDFWKSET